jgi:catechol 2,3-dioxygenase-like lactoylglutathione lyase family enzyme
MSIVGLDEVTLSTADLAVGQKYLSEFGLTTVESGANGGTFHARDATGVRLRKLGDASLPKAMASGPNIHEAMWGVSDKAALDALGAKLATDRSAQLGSDGVLRSTDDDGNAIAFRVTQRKPFTVAPSRVNVPGLPPARGANETVDFNAPVQPCTFSHLVMFSGNVPRSEKFYTERLGFRVTDRFANNAGVFLRAPGNTDHHNLFFINRPGAPTAGLNHIAFHVRDVTEVMLGGMRFAKKGWKSAWGPGRHIFGANHFWYFESPFGGNLEYDADMDIVDDSWTPREVVAGPAAASIWQTEYHLPA